MRNIVTDSLESVTVGLKGMFSRLSRNLSTKYTDSADHLRAAANALVGSDEKFARFIVSAPKFVEPPRISVISPRSSEEMLSAIYQDMYHTDGSWAARVHARSLARIPERHHHIVAAHMRGGPRGGIWLAKGSALDVGHPAWTRARGHERTGDKGQLKYTSVAGIYDPNARAVLVASRRHGSIDAAGHEFAHAFDHALGFPSQQEAFGKLYNHVIPLMKMTKLESEHFSIHNPVGKHELFAEGLAWYYTDITRRRFLGSAAAAKHLSDYFEALTSRVEIAP